MNNDLAAVVLELSSRPGHEKVRVLVHRLLVDEVGVQGPDIYFERQLPEVHGRVDALLGRTVLEFKSDLRREWRPAEEGLARYLAACEDRDQVGYVGIATDGKDFRALVLHGKGVREIGACAANADEPTALVS